MKIISAALAAQLTFVATLCVLSGSALADQKMDNMPGMAKSSMATSVEGYPARGVVKHVDVAAGTVTISHDAIKGLGWPAMTMTFTVKDKGLFHKLTVGKNVQFHVAKQGGAYVVTEVK